MQTCISVTLVDMYACVCVCVCVCVRSVSWCCTSFDREGRPAGPSLASVREASLGKRSLSRHLETSSEVLLDFLFEPTTMATKTRSVPAVPFEKILPQTPVL